MLGSTNEIIGILQVIKNSTPLSPKLLETCPLTHQRPPTPKKWPKEVANEKY
jgi:hypothetical protein